MSGLKNVLGNVYGDPNDRPQKANLDDVKESMDALTEHADEAQVASEEQLSAGTVIENAPAPAAETDTDETIGDLSTGFDDNDEDSPWAMLDELPDLNEDPPSPDEPSAMEPDREEIASEEPTTEASWLSEVQDDDSSEDWLNDYDDSGWTGSKQNETPAANVDDSNDVDELANFDFAAIADSTDEASVELHGHVGEASSSAAESFTELPDTDDPTETSTTDAGDLDPDQEAWLDDLFSLDDESEDETAKDQISPEANGIETLDPKPQPPQSAEAIGPIIEQTVASASAALDAISAVYSASDQRSNPDSDTPSTPAIDAPVGGFYGGWTRIDDDILPQKKSGRGRGHKKTEIAIAPDSQPLAQSQNRPMANDIESMSVEAPNAPDDHRDLVEANFENALLEGFSHDDVFVNESSETAPQLPAPAEAVEVPSFDQPLLQSSDELDASDAVHLFAHDEALEEAATAGGRRKARKHAAKKAKTEKAAQAKAEKEAAKQAKSATADIQAERPDGASDSRDSSAEPAPELNRKAKAAVAKAARAEKALAKKEAAKQAKAEKAKTRDASRDRKGRSPKNNDSINDEALRAQVDAALAAQVATNNGHGSDDFWTDDAAVPAAEVTPSAPAGMADPLDTELVSPPPAPVEGIDPGPVLT